MLDNILLLIGCLADTYLMALFFTHFFEEKAFLRNKLVRGLFYFLFAAVWFTGNYFGNEQLNLIISVSLILLYAFFALIGKWYHKILHFLVLFLIQFGSEFLCMLIFSFQEEEYKSMSKMAIPVIAIKFLTYLVIVVLTRFVGKNKKRMPGKIFAMYVLLPIVSMFLMIVHYYIGTYSDMSWKTLLFVVISYCCLFVANIAVFYAFYSHSDNIEQNVEQPSSLPGRLAHEKGGTKMQEEDIKKRQRRLKRIFASISTDKKKLVEDLIQNAAFLECTLIELQQEIRENGPITTSVNGNGFEVTSESAAQKSYNTTINRYSSIIKQLTELLPDNKQDAVVKAGESLAAFVVRGK